MNTHFEKSAQFAKQYCLNRYKLEKETSEIRNLINKNLQEKAQNFIDRCISKRNVDNYRVIYEKAEAAREFRNPSEIIPSNEDKAEEIYQLMLNGFGQGNNSIFMKDRYITAKQAIIEYLILHYESKQYMQSHKIEQNILIKEIIDSAFDEGIPKNVLTYTYSRLKDDLKIIGEENENSAIEYYDNLYREIKNELIQEISNV